MPRASFCRGAREDDVEALLRGFFCGGWIAEVSACSFPSFSHVAAGLCGGPFRFSAGGCFEVSANVGVAATVGVAETAVVVQLDELAAPDDRGGGRGRAFDLSTTGGGRLKASRVGERIRCVMACVWAWFSRNCFRNNLR